MKNIKIKKLTKNKEVLYDLLKNADPSSESINDYIIRGDCYVAYRDSDIIGTYVLMKTRPLTIELVNISVEKSYQGTGIGKQLLLNAIDRSKQLNAKILEVGTGNSSISQLAFYQKCGFRISSIDKDFFKNNYKERIMEDGIECIDMLRLSLSL